MDNQIHFFNFRKNVPELLPIFRLHPRDIFFAFDLRFLGAWGTPQRTHNFQVGYSELYLSFLGG